MRLVGEPASALAYRALALGSGTLAIVCAGLLGARRGAFTGVACALLAATSTTLAYYSSEARGYAPAVACFFAGWLALDRTQDRLRWRFVVLWWLCAALGLCAHFSFVFGLVALAAGSLAAQLREGPGSLLVRSAKLHGVPALCALAIWFGFVHGMAYGGGDAWSWKGVWIQAMGWTFGLPETLPWAVLGSALLGAALAFEKRERLVLALLLLAAPLATALLLKPDFVALRYFSVPLAGALILLGGVLGRLQRQGLAGRVAAPLCLCLVTGLTLARDVEYARAGRGHFREALEYIASHTTGASASLASDLPFDTRLTVEYHARGLRKPLAWFQEPPAAGVDWWIRTQVPGPSVLEIGGRRYVLERVFEAAGPSSYSWALYKRAQ